ncbi:MAG: type II toxin-antitoxin system VapC family toxin [Geminicoccaceae bacterium]
MLDTDICIHVIRDRPPNPLRQRFNEAADQLCISAITLAELLHGTEKSARPAHNLRVVEEFAARLEVLPFAQAAAAQYGQLRAELERAGQPIGAYDMLIGAHARSLGLILVTRNRREFDRISGLRVESWP